MTCEEARRHFGVTEDDIGVLTDDQFATVWGALGMVARARAQLPRSPARHGLLCGRRRGRPDRGRGVNVMRR